MKTRTKNPTDIPVGPLPAGQAVTPDGKTLLVVNGYGGTVSTIDVKTGTKNPTDIPVGSGASGLAFTPDGKTAFVASGGMGTGNGRVSTIDVKTGTKNPTDISVGPFPFGIAVTPNGKTLFVPNFDSTRRRPSMSRPGPSTPPTSPSARAPARWRSRRTARPLRLQQRQRLGLDD